MQTPQSASARPAILTVSVFRLQMIVPIASALPIRRCPPVQGPYTASTSQNLASVSQ
jgi:hypothetical protein